MLAQVLAAVAGVLLCTIGLTTDRNKSSGVVWFALGGLLLMGAVFAPALP